MADRPIIFSGPMVRALIEGRKTQTRRLLKVPKGFWIEDGEIWAMTPDGPDTCHLGYAPGDRLYVREAHALLPRTAYRMSIGTGTIAQTEHPTDGYSAAVFREGFDRSGAPRWRPSIHMPRWASRLTLTVTDVRVQRLQDISAYDVVAEGACELALVPPTDEDEAEARDIFRSLWDSLHGPDAWEANPWVVALTFGVERRNIDAGRTHA